MTATRSVTLLAVVALVTLTVAPVASGSVANAVGGDSGQPNEQNESRMNHGQSVSTFIHTNTADTENTVESELFERQYQNADNETQKALVSNRTNGLATSLESLKQERNELRNRRDELSTSEYRARMTRLTVEISALERAIEQTKPLALETNTSVSRLETIQENVAAVAGQEIAKIAKGLVGFDQSLGRGPFSDHVPGKSDVIMDNSGGDTPKQVTPGNGERGNETSGNQSGVSADRGQGPNTNASAGHDKTTPANENSGTSTDEDGTSAGQ